MSKTIKGIKVGDKVNHNNFGIGVVRVLKDGVRDGIGVEFEGVTTGHNLDGLLFPSSSKGKFVSTTYLKVIKPIKETKAQSPKVSKPQSPKFAKPIPSNILGIDTSKLKDIMGTGYGIVEGDKFKLCLTGGVAVKSDDGVYKAFKGDSNSVINTRDFVLGTNDMFLTAPTSRVEKGNLLIVDGDEAVYVTAVDEQGVATVINPQNGRIETIASTSDIFGFKTYTRVFSILTLLGVDSFGSIFDSLKAEGDIISKIKPLLLTIGGLYAMGGKDALQLSSVEKLKDNALPMLAVVGMGYAMTFIEDNAKGKSKLDVSKVVGIAKSNPMLVAGLAVAVGLLMKDKVEFPFADKLSELEVVMDKKVLIGSAGVLILLAVLGKKFGITDIQKVKELISSGLSKIKNSENNENTDVEEVLEIVE